MEGLWGRMGGRNLRTEPVWSSGVTAKKVVRDAPSCRFYILNAGGF